MASNDKHHIEYDRQAGHPPVIAVLVKQNDNGTSVVSPRFVLDEQGGIHFKMAEPFFEIEVETALLRPARRLSKASTRLAA
jgi:hypothetical protein